MLSNLSKVRPMSYSESDMYIPRISSNLAPLLFLTPPSPVEPVATQIAYNWVLRFSMHLTLISLFETLFFWAFVSKSEDTALTSLIQGYAQGALNNCANLTQDQRLITREIFDLFINQAQVDATGAAAAASRGAFNYNLIQNSWLYFGGILSTFTGVTIFGIVKGYKTDWRTLVTENLALVTLLGLYEWMFFNTIVMKYQAISMPELDRMVVDEFQQQC
jgi:hypothetical protein